MRDRSVFKVRTKRCDECLFSDNKVVDDERKAAVLQECEREDTYFICHKHNDEGVCCRGFWDEKPMSTLVMRLAVLWNRVRWVGKEDEIDLMPTDGTRMYSRCWRQ